jgi:alpha-L-rhamnosidase
VTKLSRKHIWAVQMDNVKEQQLLGLPLWPQGLNPETPGLKFSAPYTAKRQSQNLGCDMTIRIGRRKFLLLSGASATLSVLSPKTPRARAPAVRVVGMKVDYLNRPLGLENTRPLLSWRLESRRRGVKQTAYRVIVASSEALIERGRPDLWNSGIVSTSKSLGIEYDGKAPESRQRCWWQVQIWDGDGRASGPSEISWWEMGFLSAVDWSAQWLGADDALAQADRATPLDWIWGSKSEQPMERARRFRCRFSLPTATQSGVLFAVGRSGLERITAAWLDGHSICPIYPGHELTGENVILGELTSGEHVLVLEVNCQDPYPIAYVGVQSVPGLAVFARFDEGNGHSIRPLSAAPWKTSVGRNSDWFNKDYEDEAWVPVVTSAVEAPVLVDAAMNLRRPFTLDKPIVRARLYVTALGAYEARLNGRRVGDGLLSPELSDCAKRVLYQVYDVKDLLRTGTNVVALTVGDGWYASHPSWPHRYMWGPPPRRVLAQLEITLTDGSTRTIATDPSWRIRRSAIVQSELCVGEIYDARRAESGWDAPGFNDSHWDSAEVQAGPSGRFVAQVCPPIRATGVLTPRTITNPAPGVQVFDFGQNFAGWCRLRIKGKAGTRVDLRFGEELAPSGEIDQFVLAGGKAVDTFFPRGDPAGEVFEPHFVYHGFRYVQVTGLAVTPTQSVIEGIVIHNDLEITGRLRIDHPQIQRLWLNTVWTQRSNLVGIPTDCPSRAERWGYMGDAGIFWDAASFNMDVAAFTRRQMDHVRDSQHREGAFPDIGPEWPAFGAAFSPHGATPVWADGGVILPWTAWQRYGDRSIIDQNWDAMNRYLEFILRYNPDYLWQKQRGQDIGDWLAPGQEPFYEAGAQPITPNELIATAYWAHSAALLAKMAEATSRDEDAKRLRAVQERIRNAFIAHFVKADGQVGNGSQTSYILALRFGLVPESLKQAATERLVADIRQRGIALATGIVGTQFSLDVLADAGYQELVYSLLLRREDPSWGYMIDHGATTIWERWDGNLKHLYNEGSHNQYALGSVCGFLFRRIVGIDAATPGFERLVIRPVLDPRVPRGGGDYDSAVGRISIDWAQLANGDFRLEVTIPANGSARVHLPASPRARIQESRRDVAAHKDLRLVARSDGEAIVELSAGRYSFFVSS